MKANLDGLTHVFERADQELVFLTPNKRLSRFIQRQYEHYQVSRNCSAWPQLSCMPVTTWFHRLWEDWQFSGVQHEHKNLLSPSQEKSIWQHIVQQYSEDLDLFNPLAAANVARTAWNTLIAWKRDPLLPLDSESVFPKWARLFRDYCDSRALLDGSRMLDQLHHAILADELVLPSSIVLYAFDEITPQTQSIFDTLRAKGCELEMLELSLPNTCVERVAVEDCAAELTHAARWAADIVSREPQASIAIVIPDLTQQREKVEGIFTRIFEPQYIFSKHQRHANGFNISAGQPLASTPLIEAALLALKLNLQVLDSEDISRILHSPFIGCDKELHARSQLDLQLREEAYRIRVSRLRTVAGEFGKRKNEDDAESITADLYKCLHTFHQLSLSRPVEQSANDWAQLFMAQLDALAWPGERPLDTLEYQQIHAWQEVIAQFTQLDYVFSSLNLNDAIHQLGQLASDLQFQAQTTHSPVQILGVLESAGMLFDYLWVMNLDNETWPPPTNPNSLLPLRIQKAELMPRASAEKELSIAKRLIDRFSSSANKVVLSYAQRNGDKLLSVSRLIEHFPEVPVSSLSLAPVENYYHRLFHSGNVSLFADIYGPPVTNVSLIKGGTQILKDQAACPFRAFAKHRLHAQEVCEALPGLGPSERGALIHYALEDIWNTLRNQGALLACSDSQLTQLINKAIHRSFRRLGLAASIGERLQVLEAERMYPLLRAWLELEKQRKPFVVVLNETEEIMNLAGLPIHIRYDRVDRVEDDGLFIVDYKTGKLDIKKWFDPRLDEPQVPVYCIANQDKVVGAAFGQVNIHDVAFKGIAENSDEAPGLHSPDMLASEDFPNTWQGIIAYWRTALEVLAKEFITGRADVLPKNINTTCQYCSLQSLCRINEKGVSEELEQ